MKIISTKIEDVKTIQPQVFGDERILSLKDIEAPNLDDAELFDYSENLHEM